MGRLQSRSREVAAKNGFASRRLALQSGSEDDPPASQIIRGMNRSLAEQADGSVGRALHLQARPAPGILRLTV